MKKIELSKREAQELTRTMETIGKLQSGISNIHKAYSMQEKKRNSFQKEYIESMKSGESLLDEWIQALVGRMENAGERSLAKRAKKVLSSEGSIVERIKFCRSMSTTLQRADGQYILNLETELGNAKEKVRVLHQRIEHQQESIRGLQETLKLANTTIDELEAGRRKIYCETVQDRCIQTEENQNQDDLIEAVKDLLSSSVTKSHVELDGLYDRIGELQQVSKTLMDGMGAMHVEREVILMKRQQVNSEMVKLEGRIECFQEDLVQQSLDSAKEVIPLKYVESKGIQTDKLRKPQAVHEEPVHPNQQIRIEFESVEIQNMRRNNDDELDKVQRKLDESVEARQSEVTGLQIQIEELQQIIRQMMNEKGARLKEQAQSEYVHSAKEDFAGLFAECPGDDSDSTSDTILVEPIDRPLFLDESEEIKIKEIRQKDRINEIHGKSRPKHRNECKRDRLFRMHQKLDESTTDPESEVAAMQIRILELQQIMKQMMNEKGARLRKQRERPREARRRDQEYMEMFKESDGGMSDSTSESTSQTIIVRPIDRSLFADEGERRKMEWFQQEYKAMLKQVKRGIRK